MSRLEICPTCGIKLGPTQPRPETRVCSACSRSNPAGFNYCGFCATPMENTEMRARMVELAAPPGGWPSLTSELVEVRFYLQQGLFDDAYELLSIMQKRYPGHPQLSELSRRPKPARRVDTSVLALVDSVLAESANLVAKVPRRQATRFTAPAQGGSDRTDVHSVVGEVEEPDAPRAPKRPKTGSESTTRRSGAQPKVTASGTGSQRATGRAASGSTSTATRPATGPKPTAAAPAAAPRERTRIYRTVEAPPGARPVVVPATAATATPRAAAPAAAPRVMQAPPVRAPAVTGQTVASRPPQSGQTIAVDALQAPAPFPAAESSEAAAPASGRAPRKRRDSVAPRAAEPEAPPAAPPAEDKPEPRRRTTFGEHVLNRLR